MSYQTGYWMSTLYLEVLTRSGTSDKECWGLISHYVCTVFSVLGTARGRAPFTEGTKASSILRGTLHAHHVMREKILDGLTGFPKLSHVLKVHLQDNMVP
jgi:hypothetical protein